MVEKTQTLPNWNQLAQKPTNSLILTGQVFKTEELYYLSLLKFDVTDDGRRTAANLTFNNISRVLEKGSIPIFAKQNSIIAKAKSKGSARWSDSVALIEDISIVKLTDEISEIRLHFRPFGKRYKKLFGIEPLRLTYLGKYETHEGHVYVSNIKAFVFI